MSTPQGHAIILSELKKARKYTSDPILNAKIDDIIEYLNSVLKPQIMACKRMLDIVEDSYFRFYIAKSMVAYLQENNIEPFYQDIRVYSWNKQGRPVRRPFYTKPPSRTFDSYFSLSYLDYKDWDNAVQRAREHCSGCKHFSEKKERDNFIYQSCSYHHQDGCIKPDAKEAHYQRRVDYLFTHYIYLHTDDFIHNVMSLELFNMILCRSKDREVNALSKVVDDAIRLSIWTEFPSHYTKFRDCVEQRRLYKLKS